ncbi:hypothetical protein [Tenacibaculum sp. A30]|uniref:hypothetical protein n=1 Tax=Tenacibaculum sp. A30 TaxID=3442644 RepID=UPI003EC02954
MTKEKERTYKGIASFDSGKGNTMEITFPKVRPALKFIANLRRLDNYKGEFGFDWMRDDYQTICKDYEKLKKEYTLTKIHDEDYFVPWLSMFPQQEDIKLKLEVEILEGTATDVDIIKLPEKEGIRFEPEQVKVNESESKQIKIICNSPLSNDVTIDLLDKNDEKVGAISVVKNDEDLVLKVKLVKVKGDEIDNRYNEQTFSNISEHWESELFNKLTNNCFNQALIKIEKETTEEMVIDVDNYIEEGVLDVFVDDEGKRGIPRMNKGFDKKLYKDFVTKNGENNGIIFFLSAIHQKGTEAGHGYPYPRDTNYIIIVPSSVGGALETYQHELGHALGLHHVWESSNIYKDKILAIEAEQRKIEDWFNKYKEYPNKTKIGKTNETLGQRREEYKNWLNELKLEKKDRMDLSNPLFTFNKSSTENIMDYMGYYIYENGERVTINNPNNLISFWKWQWKMITKEVKKYHGK